jgi:hypothetical protein
VVSASTCADARTCLPLAPPLLRSPGGCDPPDAAAKHALLVECGLSCRAQLPSCPPIHELEAEQLHAEQLQREAELVQRCDDAHTNCAFLVSQCAPACGCRAALLL